MNDKTSEETGDVTRTGFVFRAVPLYEKHPRQALQLGQELADIANGTYDVTKSALIPDSGFQVTDGNRQMVIRWLSGLPKLPPRMLKEIADYIYNDNTGYGIKIGSAVQAKPENGRITLSAVVSCLPKDMSSALSYMMAALLSAGYAENFGRCPQCGKWFFDIPSGRPMRKYCSPAHSNSYRQKKYQKKKRQ